MGSDRWKLLALCSRAGIVHLESTFVSDDNSQITEMQIAYLPVQDIFDFYDPCTEI